MHHRHKISAFRRVQVNRFLFATLDVLEESLSLSIRRWFATVKRNPKKPLKTMPSDFISLVTQGDYGLDALLT